MAYDANLIKSCTALSFTYRPLLQESNDPSMIIDQSNAHLPCSLYIPAYWHVQFQFYQTWCFQDGESPFSDVSVRSLELLHLLVLNDDVYTEKRNLDDGDKEATFLIYGATAGRQFIILTVNHELLLYHINTKLQN